MSLLNPIAKRRSIRSFSGEPVDRQVLDSILEAGRRAPSAKNRQPWRFIVMTEPDLKKAVVSAAYGQEWLGDAAAVIALCTTNVDYQMPNGQLSYPLDISFAASFMMLQAESEGLGSCLVSTYQEAELKSVLSIPYSMRIVLLLAVGPAGDEPSGPPSHRKPLDAIASYNHW